MDESVLRPHEDLTAIGDGLFLIQKKKGWRFSEDSIALTDFFLEGRSGKEPGELSKREKKEKILEIGTGNGAIPLLLYKKGALSPMTAVEIQEDLTLLARRNMRMNGISDRVEIIRADIRSYGEGNRWDCILANPPYLTTDGKKTGDSEERAAARHELKLTAEEFVAACKRLLKPVGKLYFVHRTYRFPELASLLLRFGLFPKRAKFLQARSRKESGIVLIEAWKGKQGKFYVES
ncbi:MAG: methyltransferase [Fusobacteriaceae bacterium]|jgi:16S rRNA (guanine1207-N2)-methyltransferase|nr:methyltransferase [Fusobacteriaceae bacterium]